MSYGQPADGKGLERTYKPGSVPPGVPKGTLR